MNIVNSNEDGVPFKFSYPIRISTSRQRQQNPEPEEKDVESDHQLEDDLEALLRRIGNAEALLKLPLDVFLNILSRLPIKSLAISRCVSNPWRTIIHHPHFTTVHHTKAIQSKTDTCFNSTTSLVFTLTDCSGPHKKDRLPGFICYLEHEYDDNFDNAVLVNPAFRFADSKIVGSCNGLLCLLKGHYSWNAAMFIIWNPVTGEYTTLPKNITWHSWRGSFGFAFDQTANDYKVIVLYPYRQNKIVGEIYSFRTGQWRMLGHIPYELHHRKSSAVLLNGAFHWMGEDNGVLSTSELIVVFDVGSEQFRIVPPPLGLKPTCHPGRFKYIPHTCRQKMGVLGGCLSICDYSCNDLCEIWLMREYGVQCSWTKAYVISRGEVLRSPLNSRPLSLMKNGKILMVLNSESLVCYDPVGKSFSEIGRTGKRYKLGAITHVGSFLSLRDIVRRTNG